MKDRFWDKVNKDAARGCWEWIAAKNNMGYGVINTGRHRVRTVHRISWEMAHGAIPVGQCVLHHCDNPACVNPAHLFLGTKKDNATDREAKGRSPLGQERPNSKLTDAAVLAIRKAAGNGQISLRGLGRQYGVSLAAIRNILLGRTWKHV